MPHRLDAAARGSAGDPRPGALKPRPRAVGPHQRRSSSTHAASRTRAICVARPRRLRGRPPRGCPREAMVTSQPPSASTQLGRDRQDAGHRRVRRLELDRLRHELTGNQPREVAMERLGAGAPPRRARWGEGRSGTARLRGHRTGGSSRSCRSERARRPPRSGPAGLGTPHRAAARTQRAARVLCTVNTLAVCRRTPTDAWAIRVLAPEPTQGGSEVSDAICEVVITADDEGWLLEFTRALVRDRLVACGQHVTPVRSIYALAGRDRGECRDPSRAAHPRRPGPGRDRARPEPSTRTRCRASSCCRSSRATPTTSPGSSVRPRAPD